MEPGNAKHKRHQLNRGCTTLPQHSERKGLAEKAVAKCGSCQAENLCDSIAVSGKSQSVLWAAFVVCLSLVFAARWEKPA